MNKKKLLLTTALCLCITPAFADNEPDVDIAANASDVSCDSGVLQTSSGSSTLEADWSANHVRIKWYDGNDEIELSQADSAAAECIYDGTLTLPTAPTKNGYTFSGWKVKASATPQQTTITLSSLYDNGIINIYASKSLAPGAYCVETGNDYIYGSSDDDICSYSTFIGLNDGDWMVEMPNGIKIKGVSTCSTEHPTTPWYSNPNYTFTSDNYSTTLPAGQHSSDNSSGMQYCWCKVMNADTGDGYKNITSSSWVFLIDSDRADSCELYCADNCNDVVRHFNPFRRAVFGVSE